MSPALVTVLSWSCILTVVSALLGAATANGFQMSVTGAQSKSLPDFQVTNIQVCDSRLHY